ncbi:MAG: N-acyl-D-amino-acid deacylase family protein [Parasphingopyxis sp.]|uniref:N-acyl-D-amino-acid deacylase family protein n=1 Tax=Parasphingopyxis sp. TaxID=1920299 RepID=UPI003FA12FD5
MTQFDLLLKGGTIVDGSGAPRRRADLGIENGKIARIAESIDPDTAAEVVDVAGLIVAPGVIDPHTHYDAQINWDPYCTNSGWHGNTAFVVGNCGFGFMPCRPGDRERYMLMMENTEQIPLGAMRTALPWTWESFPEWMAHMKTLPKGVNVASFMPLNSLMIYVMGYEAAKTRGATPEERREMRRLLNEAMDHGAIGFGFSYLGDFNSHKDCDGSPMPTDNMQIEDAYYLAETLRERGQGVIQILAELPVVISNREACEELARISDRPVLHTVVAAFDKLPDYHRSVMAWLDDCAERGLAVYSQALAMRSWNEFTVIDYNAWQQVEPFYELTNAGDAEAKATLAADPAFRERARTLYNPAHMDGAGGPVETFRLLRAPGAPDWDAYSGNLFSEIAKKRECAPIDAFFDVIAATGARAEFRTTEATTEDPGKIREMLVHPRVFAGTSDGGAHVKFYSGGQFATDNIVQMARETGLMSLEELHHKLSGLPAEVFGFERRGVIAEGNWADIYVYDFDRLNYDARAYEVVHDLPDGDWRRVVRPQGIAMCLVNGKITLKDNIPTGALPGRMISNLGPETDARLADGAFELQAAE